MSLVAIALGAATASPSEATYTPETTVVAPIEVEPAYRNAIHVALPSLDTGRGLVASYERWLPRPRLSLDFRGELRESASGDYTGLRIGAGVEARWFWRADRKPWLSVLPAGNMAGWYVGLGYYVAANTLHDDRDDRSLSSALELGAVARVGYRIVPWRQLAITPSAGLEVQRDIDLSGRLAGANRGGLAYGLDVGWMF